MPQPALILDKSAFQALSRAEHAERVFRYEENIVPILLREIHSDLAKTFAGESPDAAVQTLAAKFLGSGGVINADHRTLCMGELSGMGQVEADGRPVLDEYFEVREPDGSSSILIEPTSANKAILRWACAQFTAEERLAAQSLRASAGAFSVEALYGQLRRHQVLLPRPKRVSELPEIADDILARPAMQAPLLDWLMAQLHLPPRTRLAVERRWNGAGRPLLTDFAPYAHHCTRVLLLVLIGMRHNVLSSRKTNRLDAEYLFYVPFCEVFVSGDKLHEQLAPMVLGVGRKFVSLRDFKTEMARHAVERLERRAARDLA
ncbi:MAG TPA: hypothetical protein VLM85_20260 [Polyangiaceae bacterium]|nr:hypothetical protein [Polyangiaceae bacterium]